MDLPKEAPVTPPSDALAVNLARYHVDVAIDARFDILQKVFALYPGLMETVNSLLLELSHPYRNWQFIVQETRSLALNQFNLLFNHPHGPYAARLLVEILVEAVEAETLAAVKAEAADSILFYLKKIVASGGALGFVPAIEHACQRILACEKDTFFHFVRSYHQLHRIGQALLEAPGIDPELQTSFSKLGIRYLHHCYQYWLAQPDPLPRFCQDAGQPEGLEQLTDLFSAISHHRLNQYLTALESVEEKENIEVAEALAVFTPIPGFNDLVNVYRRIPTALSSAGGSLGPQWKLLFLYHVMNISGLEMIHEETLTEINRTVSHLIGSNLPRRDIYHFIAKTFTILKDRFARFPVAALNCILAMGRVIYPSRDPDLVNVFIDAVIDMGFQSPRHEGVGDDWQLKANPAHLQNIRVWMQLIGFNPRASVRLISYLTVHLALCGVLIKDTDLFSRDVTGFLNSKIEPVYNLAKQLARLFPSYFNEIGAEGLLRDISTRIDEITGRQDVLIHFLRKQSHVESSNLIIAFMEAVLDFWLTRDKAVLKPFVPPNIFNQIETDGPLIDGVQRIMVHLANKGIGLPQGLLTLPPRRLRALAAQVPEVGDVDRQRLELAVGFYRLLNQKYNLEFIEITHSIERLKSEGLPDCDILEDALAQSDLKQKIIKLLVFQERLKALILSDQKFEIKEQIFQKRHFAIDIPSMYGSYHELKFDAMGLALRLEALLNVLFEKLVAEIDLSLITKATFFQICDRLKLFGRALKLDGISSVEIERQLDLLSHSLEVKGLTFTQYLDIFKGLTRAVKNIINDHFTNIHCDNLNGLIARVPSSQWLAKYRSAGSSVNDPDSMRHRVSEIFFRDRIAEALGLQQLDLFLSRILNTLFHQSNKLPADKLNKLLLYDPAKAITAIDRVGRYVAGQIYLGNKGFNLVKLKSFGLPVPPGFIITTETFRWRVLINSYGLAEQNLRQQVRQQIDRLNAITNKRFGDPRGPLLLSVRSGSVISQPGMMDTFLNVGINEEISAAMAGLTGNAWFAWDNYRRFLQCYGMAFGLERDRFDAIIAAQKKVRNVVLKRDLSGQDMRAVALAYKKLLQNAGIEIIEDPFEQLFLAIKLVLSSWESPKAKTYRRIMGISDDWGTAVTVQSMVFGNLSPQSGSGVVFTHNPRWSGENLQLWGDFTTSNQGEDVVSGLVRTLPISIFQQEVELRDTDTTLETHFPAIYKALKSWATELVEHRGWTPQEIEFTFESENFRDLYLLQTRDLTIRQRKNFHTFDLERAGDAIVLGSGIGVSGGAMSGRLVFSLEEIDHWRHLEPNTCLILARSDTVPDDIREIDAADGLLTSRGGVTSHAAVVAHQLDKTCVVGCGSLACDEKSRVCRFNRHLLSSGDYLSIDGQEGSVYFGQLPIRKGE
jgi:pyruvate,orthophosphate dikinase